MTQPCPDQATNNHPHYWSTGRRHGNTVWTWKKRPVRAFPGFRSVIWRKRINMPGGVTKVP